MGRKKINLVGRKFRTFTVTSQNDYIDNGKLLWNCLCSLCGQERVIRQDKVKLGSVRCKCEREVNIGDKIGAKEVIAINGPNALVQCSCGKEREYNQKHLADNKVEGIPCYHVGKFFKYKVGYEVGFLTVVELTNRSTVNRRRIYICQCECGTICERHSQELTPNKSPHCGCQRAKRKRSTKKRNEELNIGYIYLSENTWAKDARKLYGRRCEITGWDLTVNHAHHVHGKAAGGLNQLSNAIILSPNVHDYVHNVVYKEEPDRVWTREELVDFLKETL